MSDETADKLCEGYLIVGDQKNVDGGFTVDFQKQNKFFFVLWKNGHHIYNLEGFKDEKAFKGKRKSSLNPFGGRKKSIGSTNVPSFILTSAVKVHCMDMTIGRKKNHVIILIHARIPYYFKTLKEAEIKPWYKAFSSVSTDMESRNDDRTSREEVVLRRSPGLKHINSMGNDSGRGSTSSSTRSSQDSSDSRLSDLINSCPPSPSFIPTNIVVQIDPEHDDYMDMDNIQPASSGQKARRTLTKSVIYKRRERKDSCDESVRKFDFTEASGQTYDTVIRTSIVIDDTDGDITRPILPQKARVRRGSVPNLQIPNALHQHSRDPHRSPELDPLRHRERRGSQPSSPPPLPARPNTYYPQPCHNYVNVSRRPSVPASVALLSLENIYEKAPKVQEDINRLIWEQSKHIDGVVVEFSKAELLDSLVLATIKDEVWVASWKKDLNNELYGKLHVGDKLRQINTQVVTSGELAMQFIQTTSGDKIQVALSRLPHASLRNLTRSNTNIQWGIHLKSNTEIKSLSDGPVLTEDQGLTPKAKCVYSAKICDWIITEINHQRVPLVKNGRNQDLVKSEIEANHSELPLIVQPHDFIKKLTEAVEKRRSSQFY